MMIAVCCVVCLVFLVVLVGCQRIAILEQYRALNRVQTMEEEKKEVTARETRKKLTCLSTDKMTISEYIRKDVNAATPLYCL